MLSTGQLGFNAFWWERLHDEDAVRECAACLAEIGYRFVEFKRDSFQQVDLPAEFRAAARAARREGLEVSNFVVLRDLTRRDTAAVRDVVESVQACAEAEVSVLNLCVGAPAPEGESAEAWWSAPQTTHAEGWSGAVEALGAICDQADRCGVEIALEPIVGHLVCDYFSLQELLRRVAHARLGVTFDPSHFLLYRNDIPHAIRQLGPLIKHVHMKDAVGRPGQFGLDFAFPSLGAGAVDWTAFLAALDEIEYRGALSGEYEQFAYMDRVLQGDVRRAAESTYREMTALLDRYRASE